MLLRALLLVGVLAPLAWSQKVEFTVTGRVQYQDKAWGWDGWTGEDPVLPVRGADVTITRADNGKVLGRGVTAQDGTFAVVARAKGQWGPLDLVARIDTDNSHAAKGLGPAGAKTTRVRVTDPDGLEFAAFTPVAVAHDPAGDGIGDGNFDFGLLTVLPVSSGDDEGNPFNLFDLGVAAVDSLSAVGAPPDRRGMTLVWPAAGSYAHKRTAWIGPDDGYDDAVVLHEIGHVVHAIYSDSDNPGGFHWFGDSDQDPRLSFGEGYATFFAAAVLDGLGQPGIYVDAAGDVQIGGVELRLALEDAAPFTDEVAGAADEIAVACALFDLLDTSASADGQPGDDDGFDTAAGTAGDPTSLAAAWWQVFTGPVAKAKRLTANDAWDGWLDLYGAEAGAIEAVFGTYGLDFRNDAFEPDGEASLATPLPLGEAWSPTHTLYDDGGGAGPPGAADVDSYTIELLAGQIIAFETRYPDGAPDAGTQADTYLKLYSPASKRRAVAEDGGVGRNAAILDFAVDESGPWLVEATTRNKTSRYGRYQIRARLAADD